MQKFLNVQNLALITLFFYAFASSVSMDNKSLASILHLSSRTIGNYHKQKKTLEPVQGEHLLKLIGFV